MVVMEASVAQTKANQLRRGAPAGGVGGVPAAEEGRSGASVPPAACAMAAAYA